MSTIGTFDYDDNRVTISEGIYDPSDAEKQQCRADNRKTTLRIAAAGIIIALAIIGVVASDLGGEHLTLNTAFTWVLVGAVTVVAALINDVITGSRTERTYGPSSSIDALIDKMDSMRTAFFIENHPWKPLPLGMGRKGVLDVSLVFDILLDNLQGCAADSGDEVRVCPESGEPGLEGRELLSKGTG